MADGLNSPEQTPQNPLRAKYDPLLWQRAEELSGLRTPLEEHRAQVYKDVEAMRGRHLNLHEQELLGKKEETYWRLGEKIEAIGAQEDEIMQALEGLDAGEINEATLQRLTPPPIEETEQISKRKKRILEEQQRLGIDPREAAWDLYTEFGIYTYRETNFGANPIRLTTGRHQKRIGGNIDPLDAEAEFFYRTTDTHGRKVSYGKRGDYYINTSGKKIRKV